MEEAGTLREPGQPWRFDKEPYRDTVTAKTGTLKVTDHGVSVLAGETETAHGIILFVIMDMNGPPQSFRDKQDKLVKDAEEKMGGPTKLPYQPVHTAWRFYE